MRRIHVPPEDVCFLRCRRGRVGDPLRFLVDLPLVIGPYAARIESFSA